MFATILAIAVIILLGVGLNAVINAFDDAKEARLIASLRKMRQDEMRYQAEAIWRADVDARLKALEKSVRVGF